MPFMQPVLELEHAPGGVVDDLAACQYNLGYMKFAAFRPFAGSILLIELDVGPFETILASRLDVLIRKIGASLEAVAGLIDVDGVEVNGFDRYFGGIREDYQYLISRSGVRLGNLSVTHFNRTRRS